MPKPPDSPKKPKDPARPTRAKAARPDLQPLAPALAELAEKHAVVGEARGVGVFWALDLVADPETREPLPAPAVATLRKELLARGILPFTAENRIHVVPPCTVTADEVAEAVAAYDEVLALAL